MLFRTSGSVRGKNRGKWVFRVARYFGLVLELYVTLSDNDDPLSGLFIVVAVNHGLVAILESLKNVIRTKNEYEEASLFPQPNLALTA